MVNQRGQQQAKRGKTGSGRGRGRKQNNKNTPSKERLNATPPSPKSYPKPRPNYKGALRLRTPSQSQQPPTPLHSPPEQSAAAALLNLATIRAPNAPAANIPTSNSGSSAQDAEVEELRRRCHQLEERARKYQELFLDGDQSARDGEPKPGSPPALNDQDLSWFDDRTFDDSGVVLDDQGDDLVELVDNERPAREDGEGELQVEEAEAGSGKDCADEELDSDISSESSIEEVHSIPAVIAVNGLADEMTIKSDMTWDTFRVHIADKLDIPVKDLDLSYKWSIEAKNELPRRLTSPEHLVTLLDTAVKYLTGVIKTRSQKPFKVCLLNKSVAGKGKHDKENKKNSKKRKESELEGANHILRQSNDDITTMPNGTLTRVIEAKYACDTHQGHTCCVLPSGEHQKLNFADISLWATLIKQNAASLECPPPQLVPRSADPQVEKGHESLPPSQEATSQSSNSKPVQQSVPLPDHAPLLQSPLSNGVQSIVQVPLTAGLAPSLATASNGNMAITGVAPYGAQPSYPMVPSMHMPFAGSLAPWFPPYPYHYPMPYATATPMYGRPHTQSSPSDSEPPSDPPNAYPEEAIEYPLLRDWLAQLDRSRGAEGHNFRQYIEDFETAGFRRLNEITDPTLFTKDELLDICDGMTIGTATALLSHAREHVTRLQEEARRTSTRSGRRPKRARHY